MSIYVKILLLFLANMWQFSINAETLRIAFGSCYDQNKPSQVIWQSIAAHQPDLMLMMGDNVYIDSHLASDFEVGYRTFASNKALQSLAIDTDIMATWDDHDYGLQDGGKEFIAKQLAKEHFVNFFAYPELQNIPKENGIEHVRKIKIADKIIRIIMLDTRWYRDTLLPNNLSKETRTLFQLGPYKPHLDKSTTLLGERQWSWLEAILAEPVDLNVIVSSIQMLSEYTGWEIWANFPHERARLLALINQYAKGKAIFLSGDVHRAEFSTVVLNNWTLFDITSSGLSSTLYPGKPNVHRLGEAYSVKNFGLLTITTTGQSLVVKAGLYDHHNQLLSEYAIPILD